MFTSYIKHNTKNYNKIKINFLSIYYYIRKQKDNRVFKKEHSNIINLTESSQNVLLHYPFTLGNE